MNAELIKALRCENDCDDCAYHTDNAWSHCDEWGMRCDAADALEAAEKRIARLEEDLKTREAEREIMQDTIKICEEAAARTAAQERKERTMKSVTKKRKYYRKCGICGERHEQSEMIRDNGSPNGWLCMDCHIDRHTEWYI